MKNKYAYLRLTVIACLLSFVSGMTAQDAAVDALAGGFDVSGTGGAVYSARRVLTA